MASIDVDPAALTLTAERPNQTPAAPAALRPRQAFLAELEQMSVPERVRAARVGAFSRWERSVWAATFPEQVPLVNGEVEWIALGLADLD